VLVLCAFCSGAVGLNHVLLQSRSGGEPWLEVLLGRNDTVGGKKVWNVTCDACPGQGFQLSSQQLRRQAPTARAAQPRSSGAVSSRAAIAAPANASAPGQTLAPVDVRDLASRSRSFDALGLELPAQVRQRVEALEGEDRAKRRRLTLLGDDQDDDAGVDSGGDGAATAQQPYAVHVKGVKNGVCPDGVTWTVYPVRGRDIDDALGSDTRDVWVPAPAVTGAFPLDFAVIFHSLDTLRQLPDQAPIGFASPPCPHGGRLCHWRSGTGLSLPGTGGPEPD
jgi:hypothetical protein